MVNRSLMTPKIQKPKCSHIKLSLSTLTFVFNKSCFSAQWKQLSTKLNHKGNKQNKANGKERNKKSCVERPPKKQKKFVLRFFLPFFNFSANNISEKSSPFFHPFFKIN